MTLEMKIRESNELAALTFIISTVKRARNKLSEQDLLFVLDLKTEQLALILKTIDANPDMDDWEMANKLLFNDDSMSFDLCYKSKRK